MRIDSVYSRGNFVGGQSYLYLQASVNDENDRNENLFQIYPFSHHFTTMRVLYELKVLLIVGLFIFKEIRPSDPLTSKVNEVPYKYILRNLLQH